MIFLFVYLIRCIVMTDAVGIGSSFDEHTSRGHFKNFTMRWTVEDFSLASFTQKNFTSPEFPSNDKNGFKWRLEAVMKSNTYQSIGSEIYLRLTSVPKNSNYLRSNESVPTAYSFTINYESSEHVKRYQKDHFRFNKTVRIWYGDFDVPFKANDDRLVISVEVRFPDYQHDRVISNDHESLTDIDTYLNEHYTGYKYRSFTLKWTLEKFILGSLAPSKDYLKSVIFPSDDQSGYKWSLEIDPQSNEKIAKFYLRLNSFTRKGSSTESDVPALCFFSVGFKGAHFQENHLRHRFILNKPLSLGKYFLTLPYSGKEADLVAEVTVRVPVSGG